MSLNLDQIFNIAVRMANDKRHEFLTMELFLWVLVNHDEGVREVLRLCGADLERMKKELKDFIDQDDNFSILTQEQIEELSETQFSEESVRQMAQRSGISYQPELSMGMQRTLQRAAIHLQSSGKSEIKGVNVLVSMYGEQESFAIYVLKKENVSRANVIEVIAHSFDKAQNTEDATKRLTNDPSIEGETSDGKDGLLEFATNLNEKAENHKIDPLIGREKELKRIIQILCRRRKNNPLLVGEAGVGKTALAEGLALKVVNGEVPDLISNAEIYSLNMASLLAGTKYRGDFEARIKKLLEGLKKREDSGKKVILFIDEMHTIIGAGSTAGGGMDASNLLKPALANGEIRCMGSTTHSEFRKFVEKDGALTRRFQKIDVVEPSIEDTIKILKGLKGPLEEHHQVKFPKSVLEASAKLSSQYITDRKLPDKAIDVLDEIGSFLQLLPESKKRNQASVRDVEEIVSQIARIPKQNVSKNEKNKLRNLERDLKLLIFGQDHAIESVTNAIMISRSGLGSRKGPVANFLFAGPTGVGKTELAKQLSYNLGTEFIRIDMSEYMEKHSVAKLIGAPPGYVGHDQGGVLTEAVNKAPHSVVLLDEIEKAHPDVYNILLQVMDYGSLTDSNGRTTDFKNCVIILTTNAGARDMEAGSIGLSKNSSSINKRDKALKNFFSPEFRNRLTEIVNFNKLSEATLDLVVDKFLMELQESLDEKNVTIEVSHDARRYLGEKGYDEKLGARPIARIIEDEVKKPLSKEILFGELEKGGKVLVELKKDSKLDRKLTFKFEK